MTAPDAQLREKYHQGQIFLVGTIVQDLTGTNHKIINRGSNYLTLESETGKTSRKWLHEVAEVQETETVPDDDDSSVVQNAEFQIVEGQVKMFGFQTRNFDQEMSEFVVEQFSEFGDTYSKHQIIKLMDLALEESDLNTQYGYFNKVSEFYDKHGFDEPLLVEAVKNEIERKRIAEIIAKIADIPAGSSPFKTISDAIVALKEKYKVKTQWEVIAPVFRLAQEYGISGISAKLPFNLGSTVLESEDAELEIAFDVFEEYMDMLVSEVTVDEVLEVCEEQIDEVLSVQSRNKLRIDMRKHEGKLEAKRARAMKAPANTEVLTARARRLALNILKTRIFKKPAGDLSRQEKERFEAGSSKRQVLVARLAQKLIARVRETQRSRLHSHTPHHGHHQVDKALSDISGAS